MTMRTAISEAVYQLRDELRDDAEATDEQIEARIQAICAEVETGLHEEWEYIKAERESED